MIQQKVWMQVLSKFKHVLSDTNRDIIVILLLTGL